MAGSPQEGAGSSPHHPRNPAGTRAEQLPGAWSCNQCTYVNYPGRTVCEMCGYINSPSQGTFNYKGSARYNGENLQARGDQILMPPPPPQQQQNQQHQFHPYNVRTPSQNEFTELRNHEI